MWKHLRTIYPARHTSPTGVQPPPPFLGKKNKETSTVYHRDNPFQFICQLNQLAQISASLDRAKPIQKLFDGFEVQWNRMLAGRSTGPCC